MGAEATTTQTASSMDSATPICKEPESCYGDILIMPCTQFGAGDVWRDKYKSTFDKSSESGHAGHYKVTLKDHGIDAELTTTTRVGVHRYRLHEPYSHTHCRPDHRDELIHYSIELRGNDMLVGHRVNDNWAEEQHVYFAMKFDRPFNWGDQLQNHQDWLPGRRLNRSGNVHGARLWADFGVISELNVHVGLSFCDIEGAIQNLNQEAPNFDFDKHLEACERSWDEQLGRIHIDGGTEDERTIFYTALYHAATVPNVASDVDGRYRGTDQRARLDRAWRRALHGVQPLGHVPRPSSLLAWLEPNRTRNMVKSMLGCTEMADNCPFETASNYTGCMIGYHSVPVMVDAKAWQIDGWDETLALEAMVQAADSQHLGLDAVANGYIPSSTTRKRLQNLEYA